MSIVQLAYGCSDETRGLGALIKRATYYVKISTRLVTPKARQP